MNEFVTVAETTKWFETRNEPSIVIAGSLDGSSLAGLKSLGIVKQLDKHELPGETSAREISSADFVIVAEHMSRLTHAARLVLCRTTLIGPQRAIVAAYEAGHSPKSAFASMGKQVESLSSAVGSLAFEMVALTDEGHSPQWYQGRKLADCVKRSRVTDPAAQPLRFVVERSDADGCTFHGKIVSGSLAVGQAVKFLPGAHEALVSSIEQSGSKTVVRTEETVAPSAGPVICAAGQPVEVSDQFEVNIAWFGDEPLLPGRPYVLHFAGDALTGSFSHPKHVVHPLTFEHLAAKTLESGDIGVANVSLEGDVAFAPFKENRVLGGFTVSDKISGELVGAGSINFALRRASNIHWQALDLNKSARSGKLGQKSSVLWFTGLSGSGKSTIANLVEKKLYSMGHQTYLLDGDNVRHGLNRDLGFTDADRVENIRRVSEVARLMADAGLIVLVSFISPFRSERRMAREMMEDGEFIEVHVDTPLDVCEQRDVKGLYAKARRGEIKNFTGIDSDYERPELADIVLDTTRLSAEASADEIIGFLGKNGRLRP